MHNSSLSEPVVGAAAGVVALGGPAPSEGQVFNDLLMLGALVCDAPVALVSLPRAGGWRTLWYGVERGGQVSDPTLFDFLLTGVEVVEVGDLLGHPVLSGSGVVRGPMGARWLVGAALRDGRGGLLGVMCVVDRRRKELSEGQGKAVAAVVRQLEGHLERWRRGLGVGGDVVSSRRRVEGEERLLRSHDVALIFGVTDRTIINWVASGRLVALRTIGGHLRFRGEDVDRFLEDQPRPARSA